MAVNQARPSGIPRKRETIVREIRQMNISILHIILVMHTLSLTRVHFDAVGILLFTLQHAENVLMVPLPIKPVRLPLHPLLLELELPI
jgi:hypothetical protein